MTTNGPGDDDTLGELGTQLPAVDVDATTAELIARRARPQVGKGPPKRRLVLPVLVGVAIAIYLVWMIAKLVEVLLRS
ncbi:MAG TPA: hypothetical protein VFQ53_16515 [Kofleriaceae bacterium]|nr:hypothetical protein [Kofleriaceae bacterium]